MLKHSGERAKARIATGPFNGHLIIVAKVPEIEDVSVNGVKETDTATNTGRSKDKRHESTEDETKKSKLTRKDKASKATTEIRPSIDDEKTRTRDTAMSVGVDHTKILIGPGMVGVIPDDTKSPLEYTGEGAKTKVVGGTLLPDDVERPSESGVDRSGISCAAKSTKVTDRTPAHNKQLGNHTRTKK